ncbi:creatininase family protein [Sphingosinicella sp. CPCC 101087]|uniref:creatininase family protein n=1 Tax=Sphingosinicella sp. CPCC 101087 TaxID=2497754 RepID=UPI00101DEECA|nr:creatininase family protein [Sphingosinicella sp. CPCC 101087]
MSFHALLAATVALASPAPSEPAAALFAGTAGELSHVELSAAAQRGAVVLWALGALEQHGPHLPLATDVYIPQAQLAGVAGRLRQQGIESVTLPPYFWGVNHVTGAFPGSINIRPEIMAGLMEDVFASLEAAGFREVYCLTGHWDAAHVRTISEAVRRADAAGLRVRFLAPTVLADRLGLTGPTIVRVELPTKSPAFPDLHAGEDETSAMLAIRPETVRTDIARRLPPAELDPERLARWRTGGEEARRITPDGYVGDPARADARRGRERHEAIVEALTRALTESRAGRGSTPRP